MALYLNGTLLANVELTDTFNVWRIRTNEIIEAAAGLSSNNVFTGDITTFANTVTFSNTVSFGGSGGVSLLGSNTVVGGNVTMTDTLLIGSKTAGGGVMTVNHMVANTLTANGALPAAAGKVLISNSSGGMYWGTADTGTNTTVSNDTTTNATRFILFYDQQSGDVEDVNVASTKLTFNPSSGKITSTSYQGEIITATQQNITRVGTLTTLAITDIGSVVRTGVFDMTGNTIFTGNVAFNSFSNTEFKGPVTIHSDLRADEITANTLSGSFTIADSNLSGPYTIDISGSAPATQLSGTIPDSNLGGPYSINISGQAAGVTGGIAGTGTSFAVIFPYYGSQAGQDGYPGPHPYNRNPANGYYLVPSSSSFRFHSRITGANMPPGHNLSTNIRGPAAPPSTGQYYNNMNAPGTPAVTSVNSAGRRYYIGPTNVAVGKYYECGNGLDS